jgi:hypothetical protein
MKSYRERYFEDYITVPDEKRPGKVKYEYVGSFVEPFVENGSVKMYKAAMALAAGCGLLLWGIAAFQDVTFNRLRVVGGLSILAVLPWLIEMWCLLRFIFSKRLLQELDQETIAKYLEAGALLHGFLMGLAAGLGIIGSLEAMDRTGCILAAIGHLASGGISILIWRIFRRIYYHTYSSKEIKKGGERWNN